MKRITGVLSALLGAGLAASITLNVCFYQKISGGKTVRTKQKTAHPKKYGQKRKAPVKKASKPAPLSVKKTGHREFSEVYIRFNGSDHNFINLSPKSISIQPAIPFKISNESYWDHVLVKADFQPETEYLFTLRKGLENDEGRKLDYDAVFKIRFPARKTSVKALVSGLIFPLKRTNRTVPLEICNADSIQVTVLKLYENNLLRFSMEKNWDDNIQAIEYGRKIAKKTIPVKIPRNQVVNYALDLDSFLPQPTEPGIYGLILTPANGNKKGNEVQMSLAVTDLAVQSVIDKVNRCTFAAVHRLSDGTPAAGADVKLVSNKYQVLAAGITDAAGMVRLDYSKTTADPEDYPNALLVKLGKDLVFQQNTFSRGHSLAEFESDGKAVSAEPDALVYTERGVYRPGETVYTTVWVRDSGRKIYADAPCLLKIRDPKWNIIYTRQVKTSPAGTIHFPFVLPEDAPGGKYTVWCQAPDGSCVWGETGFLAADFMPDRIKVKLNAEKSELTVDDPSGKFSFGAEYYFGEPLKKSPYQFTVTAALAPLRPEWKEWTVGSTEFTAGKSFSRSGQFDGKTITVDYPGFARQRGEAYRPVALAAAAQVSEPGGRAVTDHTTVIYHPTPYYLGLQSGSEQDQAVIRWKFFPARKTVAKKPNHGKIELTIFRNEWKYLLKKNNGVLSREWVKEKRPLGKEIIDTAALDNGIWRKKLENGSYEIIAVCGDMRTDLDFWHWYGEGGARSANPSVIACTTNKTSYRPGENAVISFHSRFDGTALIAAGGRKLETYQSFPVKKGKNSLTFKLPSKIQTSACYAGITLTAGEERQFGLIRFKMEQNKHKLAVSLESPETALTKTKIKVRVKLASPEGSPQNGTVQLYAVDEGILALTRYSVPDIFGFFYGNFCCSFVFSDIYGELYPDLKIGKDGKFGGDAAGSANASAGDKDRLTGLRKAAPQSAVKVLPPLAVNGSREVELALPDHLGAMRLIAVASSADRTGSAERVLKVRDKISLLVSAPQVCAPGDECEVTFTMFNHDQPAGKMELAKIPGRPPKILIVGKGKSVSIPVRLKVPDKEGLFSFDAVLKKDDLVKRTTVKIPVRLPNPAITHSVFHTLKPGEKWNSAKSGVPAFAADAGYSLSVSSSDAAVLKEAVSWLNDYPYGCLEQTVSGAFPFLCADSLEKCGVITSGMAGTAKVKMNLAAAKILSMMLYNGAFPMWQGGTHEWSGGSVYAAHFLTASGNLRDTRQKKLLAGYLKSLLQKASASRYERAYAGYVLTLMKENQQDFLAGLRNILKSKEDDFAAFLATAGLLEAGYSGEGYPHLERLLKKEIWRTDHSAPHFSDPSARAGMTLYILMKLQSDAPEAVAKLRHTLLAALKTNGTGWGMTHANAWAVLGLAELNRRAGTEKASVSITLPDGKKVQPDLAGIVRIPLKKSGPAEVENTGRKPVYIHYQIKGVPLKAAPVQGALRITRTIRKPNGKPVQSAKQGELLEVQIDLETTGAVKDLVLSDLLPGGLEIEDERFATRAKGIPARKAKKKGPEIMEVKQEERRPGEFVLCGDLISRGKTQIVYRVRAVSRGKFAMGSVSAEAMYDPNTHAFEPGNGIFEVK